MEPLPPMEELWLQQIMKMRLHLYLIMIILIKNHFLSQNDNYFPGIAEKVEMPENGVIVGEDQYEKARSQAEISSVISGPIPTEPKFKSIIIIMMIDLLHLEVNQTKVIIMGTLLLLVVGSQILDI